MNESPHDPTEEPRKAFPASAMVLLLAVAGGWFLYSRPLQTGRPTESNPYTHELAAIEDVQARLWQDPLRMVHQHRKQPAKNRMAGDGGDSGNTGRAPGAPDETVDKFQALQAELAGPMWELRNQMVAGEELELDLVKRLAGGETLEKDANGLAPDLASKYGVGIIVALVPGGPYAEDAEKRRRDRQAIVSALSTKGYVPQVSDRMGYFNLHWSSGRRLLRGLVTWPRLQGLPEVRAGAEETPREPPLEQEDRDPIAVPFERFVRDKLRESQARGPVHKVLILWMDEAAVGPLLFENLNGILNDLLKERMSLASDVVEAARQAGAVVSTNAWRDLLWATTSAHVLGPPDSEGLLRMLGQKKAPVVPAPSEEQSVNSTSAPPAARSGVTPQPTPRSAGATNVALAATADRSSIIQEVGQKLADDLVQLANDYLDYGLAPADQHRLQGVLPTEITLLLQTRAVAVFRRTLAAIGNVLVRENESVRSDQELAVLEWLDIHYDDIAASLMLDGKQTLPPEQIEAWRILHQADGYLDNGLPLDAAGLTKAHENLAEALSLESPNLFPGYDRTNIARALARSFPLTWDSDPQWAETVVEDWQPLDILPLSPYGAQETDAGPASARQYVQELWASLRGQASSPQQEQESSVRPAVEWGSLAGELWTILGQFSPVDPWPRPPANAGGKLRDHVQANAHAVLAAGTCPTALFDALFEPVWTPGLLDRLREVLRGNLPGIIDSDPDWYSTIVSTWYSQNRPILDSPFLAQLLAPGDTTPTPASQASPATAQASLARDKPTEPLQDWAEGAKIDARAGLSTLKHLQILSPRATAPELLLLRAVKDEFDKTPPMPSIAESIRNNSGPRFVRTTVPDDELAIALVDELELRGVDLGSGQDHVALIGEWDTLYGRALPFTIQAAIQHRAAARSALWTMEGALELMFAGKVSSPPWVHRFSYLRGVDGVIPGERPDQASSREAGEDSGSSNQKQPDLDEYELPVGASQLDHIRRMATQLRLLDASLAESGQGRLRVVGVTGSDVYDIQLILQALRATFPDVLFFTTDLDARLLHRGQYNWSRNLIVASSFGLELTPDLQKDIPPFRDSYQTATYFSCLLALGGETFDVCEPAAHVPSRPHDEHLAPRVTITQQNVTNYLKPRVFEVARSGAYDITPHAMYSPIHPPRRAAYPTPHVALRGIAVLVTGLVFVAAITPRFRRSLGADKAQASDSGRAGPGLGFLLLAVGGCLALFGLIVWDNWQGSGEPFELVEGISVWPTQLCRFLAIVLSLFFIRLTHVRLAESDRRLARDYGLELDEAGTSTLCQVWQTARQELAKRKPDKALRFLAPLRRRLKVEFDAVIQTAKSICICWSDPDPAEPETKVDVNVEWKEYRRRGRLHHRVLRVAVLGILYAGFCVALVRLFGMPLSPHRGLIALWTDRILMAGSVAAIGFLVFYVVDATRLCEQFVRALRAGASNWPAKARLAEVRSRNFVNLGDAADYLDVRVIARCTETIRPLVIYPFVVVFVVLLSMNGYVDRWAWPLSLILIFLITGGYAIASATGLRRAAEKARRSALARLNGQLLAALKSKNDPRVHQTQHLMKEIRSIRCGAFTSWANNPVVRALVWPFSGLGIVAILDYVATLGL